MANLSKVNKKQLNNMTTHAKGLRNYYDMVSQGHIYAPQVTNPQRKRVQADNMVSTLEGEARRRSGGKKFKVTFPSSSVVIENDFDKQMLAQSGLTMKVGKKNTSFVGSKKDIKNYFYTYGSDVTDKEIKSYRAKRQAKHIERAKKVKKGI